MERTKNQKWLFSYFKDWKNILTFVFLLLLVAVGFVLRVRNLGYLSFWGDDGHTVIGTLGIIKNGYPRLPSGYVLFHSILDYYLNVIPVSIFGVNEFSFRLTSVICGCGSIILTYFTGKDLANKFTGFLGASLITFSTWYIQFSREARYYAALQFFFLLSFYFFYKGFIKEQKPYRIVATVLFIISPLIHGNAFFLIFAFIALIFFKGRKFFKREIIVPFLIILATYIFQVVNQVFFWKVGRSFYAEGGGISNFLDAYFRLPDPYYLKILQQMFPQMFFVFLSGVFIFVGITVFMSIKRSSSFMDIYLNENAMVAGRVRFPFNIFLIYFIFMVSILVISLGQMYNQQRYIYFLMPLFVLGFSYTVFILSLTATFLIKKAYSKISKKQISNKVFTAALIIIFLILIFFTVSGVDPAQALAIPDIGHSDRLDTFYSISTAMPYHWDAALTGKYVADHISEGDIVITTDIYNTYPYTGKIDYWLWTGDLVSWQPYHEDADGQLRDDTYGVVLIRDIYSFLDVMNDNHDKNIWILTSYSLNIQQHVDPVFRNFFESSQDEYVMTGRDNIARLYFFPKTENTDRVSITDFISATLENTLIPSPDGNIILGLADPANQKYLVTGWGSVENGLGTWGTAKTSVLYFDMDLSPKRPEEQYPGYSLILTVKPLAHPDLLQTVDVYINDTLADRLSLIKKDDFGQYSTVIIRGSLRDGVNTIRFKYGYNLTPQELGLGPDTRQLSVLFKSIELKLFKR